MWSSRLTAITVFVHKDQRSCPGELLPKFSFELVVALFRIGGPNDNNHSLIGMKLDGCSVLYMAAEDNSKAAFDTECSYWSLETMKVSKVM